MEAPIPLEHEYETGCPIWLWPGSLEIGQQSGRVRRGLWAVARPLERVSVGAIPEFIPMFLPGLGELRAGKNGTGGPYAHPWDGNEWEQCDRHDRGCRSAEGCGYEACRRGAQAAIAHRGGWCRGRRRAFLTVLLGQSQPGVTNVERYPYNTGGRDPDLG